MSNLALLTMQLAGYLAGTFALIALASWFGVRRVVLGVLLVLGVILTARSATVQFADGRICALPAGAYSTSPLLLPVCGGYFTCKPGGTAYLATATLVVQTECTEHIFIAGFEAQP